MNHGSQIGPWTGLRQNPIAHRVTSGRHLSLVYILPDTHVHTQLRTLYHLVPPAINLYHIPDLLVPSTQKQLPVSILNTRSARPDTNPLIVIGDASCRRASRFHAPTKGIGLRHMLHKQGFHVLFLNEFKTSTSCPSCFSPTQTFQDRRSRRPWKWHLPPQRVHGLLECRHERCVAECNGQSKKWNRDLLAMLNFQRIWNAYVSGNDRPQDLRQGTLPMSMSCADVDNYRSDNSDPLIGTGLDI